MERLTRVLAATDLSAPARHAAERAALLASETGATLDLIHVATLAPLESFRRLVAGIPVELEERVLDAAREKVRELAAALQEAHGVRAGTHVVAGPLLSRIAAHADAADLVVLGARGASFMRHLLLGSTAERMIKRASRPTLVVKQAAHDRYQTVLVPVDFSPHSVPAVRTARATAPGADIVLLHAFEVPFEGTLRSTGVREETIGHYRAAAKEAAAHRLRSLCREAGLSEHETRLMIVHGDPTLNIIEQEQEQDCDLIAIGKHGESPLEELLLGSVTKHVLAESQCDVLVSVGKAP
jgi:nucleotide-binding universal stress UspA family protein